MAGQESPGYNLTGVGPSFSKALVVTIQGIMPFESPIQAWMMSQEQVIK
jgi:hypothetical protein